MDIRLKAIRKTAGQLAVMFSVSAILAYISMHLSAETLFNVFILALIGFGSWMIYKVNLSSLQHEETVSRLDRDIK